MFFYLLYQGKFKNHPLLLKLVPQQKRVEIRALLGAIILYFIAHIILFTKLFDFSLHESQKYFWAIFIVDIFITGTIIYQTDDLLSNMNAVENKLDSILKKENNKRNSTHKTVHFEMNMNKEEDTSIESGDSEFDLEDFEKSL